MQQDECCTGQKAKKPKQTKANLIRDLVLTMAAENRDWGVHRIHGELKALGHKISWHTVRRVMQEHGLLNDPDKPRKMTWMEFIRSHWESLAACDFFTVEVWGKTGLARYLVLFFIDLSTRRVEIAGIHHDPAEPQMLQMARNVTDADTGFLKGKRCLIHDADRLYTKKFRATLKAAGVRCLKTPPNSPNLNAYAERFVLTIKTECLDKMILFGERHLRHVVSEYVEHYNSERPHQGIGNRRIGQADDPPLVEGKVACRQRLGGLLKSYYREAA